MLVDDIRIEPIPDGVKLSGSLFSATRQIRFPLWFEFTSAMPLAPLRPMGDPFLAAALLVGMKFGEPLRIEAPVSNQLLRNLPSILDIYEAWVPGARRIEVDCPVHGEISGAAHQACLFSGGVDSFYSFLKHQESISHFVTVQGFDVDLGNDALFRQVKECVQRVADAKGVVPIFARTNLRQLSDQFISWIAYFGAAAFAVSLGLQEVLRTCFIGSTLAYTNPVPWGSHPLLDPLWSTENLALIHDGAEASRVRKVARIAEDPLAMETLRVCWQGSSYNCGKCEKCLRTMLELHLAGALGKCATLPSVLLPERLAELRVKSQVQTSFLLDAKRALGSEGQDLAYRNAIDQALVRWSTADAGNDEMNRTPEREALAEARQELRAVHRTMEELRRENENLRSTPASIPNPTVLGRFLKMLREQRAP